MLSRLSKGTLYQLLYGASQSEGVRRHALETDPNAILQKAEKAESSSGSKWYSLGSSKDKLEGAAGLYVQAANAFRMANQQEQAGKAFAKAAEVQTKAGEIMDAANTYQDAFKMYRKIDPQRAVDYLNITVNTYALGTKETGGNPRRAATQLQVVGEVYETEEFANLDKQTRIMKAIEAYEKAAGWFTAEGAPALANKLLLKMAELAASVGQVEGPPAFEGYIMASELFEQVSKESVSNNLMKWSVKDYLLKAGICRLAQNDLPAANGALRNYREWDTTFPSTMEHQLLVDLIEAVNSKDAEEFAGKLYEYDQKSKLDKWKTDILLKIKNKIEEDVDDFS